MNRTKIDWVKNPDGTQGYTWNPITGCLNGCDYCYAKKLANGRLKIKYLINNHLAPFYIYEKGVRKELRELDAFYPRFWPLRISEALYEVGKPKGIFVCDMGELFGDWIPRQWQDEIFTVVRYHSDYRFYLLTKQPQNLIKFSPFPDNCWVGVTATDEISAWSASFWMSMTGTINVKAKVKFLSIEPLLKSIDGSYDFPSMTKETYLEQILSPFNQVIIGAQTQPYKPPKIEWVQEIVVACDKAGIPVFLKDNLAPMLRKEAPMKPRIYFEGWEYNKPLSHGELRQEMPEGR